MRRLAARCFELHGSANSVIESRPLQILWLVLHNSYSNSAVVSRRFPLSNYLKTIGYGLHDEVARARLRNQPSPCSRAGAWNCNIHHLQPLPGRSSQAHTRNPIQPRVSEIDMGRYTLVGRGAIPSTVGMGSASGAWSPVIPNLHLSFPHSNRRRVRLSRSRRHSRPSSQGI